MLRDVLNIWGLPIIGNPIISKGVVGKESVEPLFRNHADMIYRKNSIRTTGLVRV
ncbi:hypothetical protein LINPERHAP2_LOCUS23815, partial [Linum perenne]